MFFRERKIVFAIKVCSLLWFLKENPFRTDQNKRQISWKSFSFGRFGIRENMWWTRYSSKQRRRTAGDSAERLPPLAKTQTTSARGSSSTSSLNNTAPNAGPSAASNGEYLESSRFPVLRSSSCENPSNNDIGSIPRDQLTPPGLTNLNLQHLPAVGGRRLLLPPIHQQMGQIGQLQALCYLVVLILVSHFRVIWIFLLHFC